MESVSWDIFGANFFGSGAAEIINRKAKKFGITNALLVTEEHLVKYGIATTIERKMKESGLKVVVFDKVRSDLADDFSAEGAALAKKEDVDGIVAVGSDRSIHTARAIAALVGNPDTQNGVYYKSGLIDDKNISQFASVPVTTGTGSKDAQYAVIGLKTATS